MFTILNLLNYSLGKPINTLILILITIGIYFGLIKYFYETIHDNYIYTLTLLILMFIDIISIILIYFYFTDSNSTNILQIENSQKINVKKDKDDKKKSKKDKDEKKVKKDDTCGEQIKDKENLPIQTFITNNEEKELISLFDINKDPSICTYK